MNLGYIILSSILGIICCTLGVKVFNHYRKDQQKGIIECKKEIKDLTNFPFEMSENEKNCFERNIKNSKIYLEFGSGGSTFFALLKTSSKVFSIESDPKWLSYLREWDFIKTHEKNRLTFLCVDIGKTGDWGVPINKEKENNFPNYSKQIYKTIDGQTIDIVLIDGRFRVACILGTLLNCRKDVKIIVHDFWNRPEYKDVFEFLEVVDYADTMAVFCSKDNLNKEKLKSCMKKFAYDWR